MTEYTKRMMRILYTLIISAVLGLCLQAQPFAQDYILGEGDVLTISVYGQPDLKSVVRISGGRHDHLSLNRPGPGRRPER